MERGCVLALTMTRDNAAQAHGHTGFNYLIKGVQATMDKIDTWDVR